MGEHNMPGVLILFPPHLHFLITELLISANRLEQFWRNIHFGCKALRIGHRDIDFQIGSWFEGRRVGLQDNDEFAVDLKRGGGYCALSVVSPSVQSLRQDASVLDGDPDNRTEVIFSARTAL